MFALRCLKPVVKSLLLVCGVVMTWFLLQSKGSTLSPSRSVRDIRRQHTIPKTAVFNLTCPVFQLFQVDAHLKDNLTFFTLRQEKITLLPSEYNIRGSSVCHNRDVTLLIIIPSVVRDSDARMAIRETWASVLYHPDQQQRPPVALVFMFGDVNLLTYEKMILQREAKLFHDIATINMQDSYQNLSLKIASSLQWSVNMCGHTKFVAKVDMDTLLNINSMLLLLDHISPTDVMVLGHRHPNEMPPVIRTGKWAVPKDVLALPYYPRYMHGHSYVLTRSAIDRIVSAFPYFPIIPNEDAFVTGIMAVTTNVTRVHSAAFGHLRIKMTCFDFLYGRFVSLLYNITTLRRMWPLLQNETCITKDDIS